MKSLGKTTAICIMCAAMLVGTQGFARENKTVLTEIGTIKDPDGRFFASEGVLCGDNGDAKSLYGYDGKMVNVGSQWEAIELAAGFYVVTVPGPEISAYGLMKEDGTMLIQPGPALIKRMDDSERFVQVMYAEEKAENEDEALITIYETHEMLYNGYWKIYDLWAERFVDALTFTSAGTEVAVCADETIWVKEPERDAVLYDAEGTVIADSVDCGPSGSFFIVTRKEENKCIAYNSRFEKLFETEYPLESNAELGGYIGYADFNDEYELVHGLLDAGGNIVLEAAYDGIAEVDESLVQIYTYNEDVYRKYGVVTLSGEEVLPCEYDHIYECGDGYLKCTKETGDDTPDQVTILGPDGSVYDNVDAGYGQTMNDDLIAWKWLQDSAMVYVMNDAAFTLKLNAPRTMAGSLGLLTDRSPETGKYALYDTVSGEQLFDYCYDEIWEAYGYIYACRDGVYTIYKQVDYQT